jgi:transcriptional regulator with XRE-family HTH domain
MNPKNQKIFDPANPHIALSTGEVIRMLRELKGWTQAELAARCGISPTNIRLLENEKIEIGKKRAEQIAKASAVHPAIIMFPVYEGTAGSHETFFSLKPKNLRCKNENRVLMFSS